MGCTGFNRNTRLDPPQRSGAAGQHMPGSDQAINQGSRENDQVTGLALEQLVAHFAN
jgi:hypothetical protein